MAHPIDGVLCKALEDSVHVMAAGVCAHVGRHDRNRRDQPDHALLQGINGLKGGCLSIAPQVGLGPIGQCQHREQPKPQAHQQHQRGRQQRAERVLPHSRKGRLLRWEVGQGGHHGMRTRLRGGSWPVPCARVY